MRKWIGAMTSSGFVLAFATVAAAQQAPQDNWYGDRYAYGWPLWWICPLMMLVMIGVIAVIILMRRHGLAGLGAGHDSTAAALQILNERLARGEMQRSEYEEKKATILSTR